MGANRQTNGQPLSVHVTEDDQMLNQEQRDVPGVPLTHPLLPGRVQQPSPRLNQIPHPDFSSTSFQRQAPSPHMPLTSLAYNPLKSSFFLHPGMHPHDLLRCSLYSPKIGFNASWSYCEAAQQQPAVPGL